MPPRGAAWTVRGTPASRRCGRSTLFDPPQPIEVIAEVPDGPPRRFRWRRQRTRSSATKGRSGSRRNGGGTRRTSAGADPRLLPGRGCATVGVSGCSATASTTTEKPDPALVSARPVRMTRLCRTGRGDAISPSCAARRTRRTWSRRAVDSAMHGIGIADRNTVAGVVRAHVALRDAHKAAARSASRTCASSWSSARGWCSPMARPTSSPIPPRGTAGGG